MIMRRVFIFITAAMLAALFGCAAKAPVLQEGKQVEVFVLVDRGITDKMNEEEKKDRNEMGQFMEEDLVNMLNHEGYKAVLIGRKDQYPQAAARYLLTAKIKDLHTVGRSARAWVGAMAGSSWIEGHFTLTGSGKKTLFSYDERRDTIRDWTTSPHELHEGALVKINELLNKNAK